MNTEFDTLRKCLGFVRGSWRKSMAAFPFRATILAMRGVALYAAVAVLAGAPLLYAQHGMGGGFSAGMGRAGAAPAPHVAGNGVPHNVPTGNNGRPVPGMTSGRHHHHGNGFNNGVFLGGPFWGGPFWDDGEEVVYEQPPEQAPAQPQAAAVSARVLSPSRPPAEPLMIEWQGDRYVRVGNVAQNQAAQRDYSEGPRGKSSSRTAPASLPPAVLAFRDGTRQEVNSYTIVGNTLYESGDYWTQGYWTKKVQLADLDLPETIRLNQQRGVAFKLPTAPNDIVTRP
jgi:hypothetical protein